ncbi:MAG: single-stranded DNA-binding protein [Acidimicrobiales bacterium]
MNSISLVGRLTVDPELRPLTDTSTVCCLRLAVDNPRRQDQPLYINIQAWGRLGETCAEHLAKGRLIAVTGRLDLDQWTTTPPEAAGPQTARRALRQQPAPAGERRSAYYVTADTITFLDSPTAR